MDEDLIRRVLAERRFDLYPRAATLIADLEDALRIPRLAHAYRSFEELRRLLRTHAAILTRAVFREMEVVEALLGPPPPESGRPAARRVPPVEVEKVAAHVQALDVAIARTLQDPEVHPVEEVLDLPAAAVALLLQGEEHDRERRTRRASAREAEQLQDEGIGALKENRPRRAVTLLRRAIDKDPERAILWNDLGIALVRAGSAGEAIEAYQQAARLNDQFPERRTPEWTVVYYNEALAHLRLAREADARDDVEAALSHLEAAAGRYEAYVRSTPAGAKSAAARKGADACREQMALLRSEIRTEREDLSGAAPAHPAAAEAGAKVGESEEEAEEAPPPAGAETGIPGNGREVAVEAAGVAAASAPADTPATAAQPEEPAGRGSDAGKSGAEAPPSPEARLGPRGAPARERVTESPEAPPLELA